MMNLPGSLNSLLRVPRLTVPRMALALACATLADGIQLVLGLGGWMLADQLIDCAAMVVLSRCIGFHVLLLPTFIVELIPLVDDLPTWTACAIAVIALRKREQKRPPPPPSGPPAIDV